MTITQCVSLSPITLNASVTCPTPTSFNSPSNMFACSFPSASFSFHLMPVVTNNETYFVLSLLMTVRNHFAWHLDNLFMSFRYADDTVLISENENDLQQLLNIIESKSKEKGLELNSKKTEVMLISRKEEPSLINITINGIKLKQRDLFKYLGALISSDGRNNTEISARVAQAKMTFQKMKTVLTNSHISIHTRKRTL